MKTKSFRQLLFFLTMFLLGIGVASAQNMRDRRPPGGERGWDKIEEFKKLKMIEELNLNEDESVKFYVKYNNLTSQFKDIEKERRKSISELEAILNDPAKSAELEKKIEYIESLELKLLNNRVNFLSDIKKILSLEKVARYIIFERNFQRELQKTIRDFRKPPMDK